MYLLYKFDAESREWWLVGQYTTRHQADLIAADYRRRGEKVRVRVDRD